MGYTESMEVRIRASDFQLSTETSKYLDQKLASLEKVLGTDAALARCEVELSRSGGAQRHGEYVWLAEIQIIYPGGRRLVARNQEPTINSAIDNAQGEAMMQLRKERRLHSRVLRRTGAAIKRWTRFGADQG
jgi:ribosome-associated translation inhibitor RaiA